MLATYSLSRTYEQRKYCYRK